VVDAKSRRGTYRPGTVTKVFTDAAGTQWVRVQYDEGTLGSVQVET
jgi:hypothetical protein